MHLQDGYLPLPVLIGGALAAAGLTAATLPALMRASPPRVAMATAAFFVSSTVLKFPVGPTTVHLSLLGLVGVLLGPAAFPAVLVGLLLQWLLVAHGGLTTLGVNACVLGCGALLAGWVFRRPRPRSPAWRGALAGGLGTLLALLLHGAALLSAGRPLERVAWVALALHAPVLALEALVTGQAVAFLARVQPELVTPAAPVETAPSPEPAA